MNPAHIALQVASNRVPSANISFAYVRQHTERAHREVDNICFDVSAMRPAGCDATETRLITRCDIRHLARSADDSGDLFATTQVPRRVPVINRAAPPELTAARSLCRQLRRIHAPRDKQRIAHLICLNLLSMLRHGPS